MPIKYMEGDIFDSTVDILVNPVNCRGVMGGGLALEFKTRYPDMNAEYELACRAGAVKVGSPWFWYNLYRVDDGKHVLCFPTKDHWRDPSELSYIEDGLGVMVRNAKSLKYIRLTSYAFPKLGCGLGGLEWQVVKVVMETYLESLVDYGFEVEVWI